jgi:small subunit ribosomal protein S9
MDPGGAHEGCVHAEHSELSVSLPRLASIHAHSRSHAHSRAPFVFVDFVCVLRLRAAGTGDIYVNGYRYVEYFPELDHRWEVCAPFFYTGTLTDFDMIAVVNGGGRSGQAGAIKHAAAKALQNYNRKKFRPILKKSQWITPFARSLFCAARAWRVLRHRRCSSLMSCLAVPLSACVCCTPEFLLTRDTRVVERKKYGQKKARKQFTFVKR